MKQKAKISYTWNEKKQEIFFFPHSFKTAYEHAEEFIRRNKGSFKMKVYHLNDSGYGEKWKHVKTI